jgi:hypothetical protein
MAQRSRVVAATVLTRCRKAFELLYGRNLEKYREIVAHYKQNLMGYFGEGSELHVHRNIDSMSQADEVSDRHEDSTENLNKCYSCYTLVKNLAALCPETL